MSRKVSVFKKKIELIIDGRRHGHKAMRGCHSKLRYFDWDGQVHLAKGKTGGQQGDPLEMLIFNLTIHHLWGRVLAKFPEARAIAYADDGYIKANYL